MILRTLIFYIALTIQIRIMGKRQLGQLEPMEFVVTMFLANLASIPLENREESIFAGLLPMVVVLILERSLSYLSLKSISLRRLLCGNPVILIDNGNLLAHNLRKTRITLDELSRHLRQQGVLEIECVQFAILETDGSITVFPFPEHRPASAKDAAITVSPQHLPYTLISGGKILSGNLDILGKDVRWIQSFLDEKGCTPEDIMLLTLTSEGKTHLIRRDIPGGDSKKT